MDFNNRDIKVKKRLKRLSLITDKMIKELKKKGLDDLAKEIEQTFYFYKNYLLVSIKLEKKLFVLVNRLKAIATISKFLQESENKFQITTDKEAKQKYYDKH